MNSFAISERCKRIPDLSTDRLILTKMKMSHADDMFEYASDPRVTRYLLWAPHEDREDTKRYLRQTQTNYKNGNFYDWALVLKHSRKMIGTCGFVGFDTNNNSTEVGYVINYDYWGNGYAAEALREVIKFGFIELRLNRIQARFIRGNESSLRVMEKAGMRFEGYARQSMYIKDGYKDIGCAAVVYYDFVHT